MSEGRRCRFGHDILLLVYGHHSAERNPCGYRCLRHRYLGQPLYSGDLPQRQTLQPYREGRHRRNGYLRRPAAGRPADLRLRILGRLRRRQRRQLHGQDLQYGESEVDHGNRAVRRQQRRAGCVLRPRDVRSDGLFLQARNPETSFRSAGGKDQRPERNPRRGAETHGIRGRFQGSSHDVQRPDGRSERIGRRQL